MNRKLFSVITLLISIVQQSIGQDFKQIEAKIDSLITNRAIPSIAVGVLKDGEVLYEKAFGYSDIEDGVKSTIHTPYQLASLSKPITASAVMKLHEGDIINLDDPITKYVSLKKVDSSFKDPTIRQVMNHTSGLGTYFDIYYADETVRFMPFEEAWDRYGIQLHAPGRVSEYSNLGYGLLDHIISKVTGSFQEYLQNIIFRPLRMDDAFLINSRLDKEQTLAKSYGPALNELPHLWTNTPGAGNIAASVHDLLQFASAHLTVPSSNVLEASLIDEMQTYREPNALFHYYQDTFYGLGWYVMKDDGGQQVVWHEGGMMGASSSLKLYPNENIAIALLTNTFNSSLCRTLTDLIATELIQNYQATPINEIAEYKPISSDTTFLGTWTGVMHIEEQEVPVTLHIENETIQLSYVDDTYKSFLTDYELLPFNSQLLFGLVNQSYFAGTGVGELSAADRRGGCHPHLLSFRLLKANNSLKGEIIYMAAAEREYYALPYSIALEKTISNK